MPLPRNGEYTKLRQSEMPILESLDVRKCLRIMLLQQLTLHLVTRLDSHKLEILAKVKKFKTVSGDDLQIRIGLNSGPITAGILGELNPHWCIVGDTVNTASRMESTSKAMSIHISKATYDLIKDFGFLLSDPEEMEIKGKGKMITYWVYGREY